jgi:glutaredoxin
MSATANQLDANSNDVATLYLCGADAASCREAQMPELIRKLVFDGELYANSSVHEAARKILQTIHAARACIWSNTIRYSVGGRTFRTILHLGRDNQEEVTFDPAKLGAWIQTCDKDMVGVALNLDLGPGAGHANMLIIDRKRKQIEHFEPHGDAMGSMSKAQNEQFHNDVQAVMAKAGLADYKYLPPSEVCPDFALGSSYVNEFGQKVNAKKVGIQGFLNRNRARSEFAGTCAIWSLWYLHVRLQSPKLGPKQALKRAMSMAIDLDDAKFPEGLESVCNNAEVNDGEWCLDEYVPPKEYAYTLEQFRKHCKPACDHMEAVQKGGMTLEDFIIRFTTQLISMLQIEIVTDYRRVCGGGSYYKFKSVEEGNASAQADREGCGPTEAVQVIQAGDGRKLISIDAKKMKDIAGDGSSLPTNIPTPDAATYVVYGRKGCPYCVKAQKLIKTAKVDGVYVSKNDYDADAYSDKVRVHVPASHNTVPVVFHKGQFLGGFTEFKQHVSGGTPAPAPSKPAAPKAAPSKPAAPKAAPSKPAAPKTAPSKPAAPKAAPSKPAATPKPKGTKGRMVKPAASAPKGRRKSARPATAPPARPTAPPARPTAPRRSSARVRQTRSSQLRQKQHMRGPY